MGLGLYPGKISVYDMQCIASHKIIRPCQINLITDRIVNGNKQKNKATIFLSVKQFQNIKVTSPLR